ncbi:MAG: NTE family protein [Myxococcota bacterium]|jgi:NTE family protein
MSLSAGFFGFYAHTGFMAALEDEGLVPDGLSGSSAGALVSGLWAAGVDTDSIAERLLEVERNDFWDPGMGAGLLEGRRFQDLLRQYLPVTVFEQCRAPLQISVFELRSRKTRVIRTGRLAPAIHASCTFPGLFHPVRIDGRLFIDGGVLDRSGLAELPPGRVLYHHLSSRSKLRGRVPAITGCPKRPGMVSIITENLPRVGPFKLKRGQHAFEHARAAMVAGLDRPVVAGGAPTIIG